MTKSAKIIAELRFNTRKVKFLTKKSISARHTSLFNKLQILSKITILPRQKSIFCIKNHYFASKITILHQKSLFCIENHFFASKITMLCQKSLFCVKNHYFASKITILCQKSLFCVKNHYFVSKITMLYQKSISIKQSSICIIKSARA